VHTAAFTDRSLCPREWTFYFNNLLKSFAFVLITLKEGMQIQMKKGSQAKRNSG